MCVWKPQERNSAVISALSGLLRDIMGTWTVWSSVRAVHTVVCCWELQWHLVGRAGYFSAVRLVWSQVAPQFSCTAGARMGSTGCWGGASQEMLNLEQSLSLSSLTLISLLSMHQQQVLWSWRYFLSKKENRNLSYLYLGSNIQFIHHESCLCCHLTQSVLQITHIRFSVLVTVSKNATFSWSYGFFSQNS